MLNTLRIFSLAGVSALAVMVTPMAMAEMDASNNAAVMAQSTSKTITIKPAAQNIMQHDLNGDHLLSPAEIGDVLFYKFDTDGNKFIDNIEWKKSIAMPVATIEKTTTTATDTNGDGVAEDEIIDIEIITKTTGLEGLDKNGDGLSAQEFTKKSIYQLDLDRSGLIEMKEWKKSYMDNRAPLAANNDIYNNGE